MYRIGSNINCYKSAVNLSEEGYKVMSCLRQRKLLFSVYYSFSMMYNYVKKAIKKYVFL